MSQPHLCNCSSPRTTCKTKGDPHSAKCFLWLSVASTLRQKVFSAFATLCIPWVSFHKEQAAQGPSALHSGTGPGLCRLQFKTEHYDHTPSALPKSPKAQEQGFQIGWTLFSETHFAEQSNPISDNGLSEAPLGVYVSPQGWADMILCTGHGQPYVSASGHRMD